MIIGLDKVDNLANHQGMALAMTSKGDGAAVLERARPDLGRTTRNELSALIRKVIQGASPALDASAVTAALSSVFFSTLVEATAGRVDRRRLQALVRGGAARTEMINSRGGTLSAAETAGLLGRSKTQVFNDFEKGKLLGIRVQKQNAVLFPVWQFDLERQAVKEQVAASLAVLAEVSEMDGWTKLTFFLAPRDSLSGKAPVDLLDSGEPERLVQLARAYVD